MDDLAKLAEIIRKENRERFGEVFQRAVRAAMVVETQKACDTFGARPDSLDERDVAVMEFIKSLTPTSL